MSEERALVWILDEQGEPVSEEDTLTWARWFTAHDAERMVAKTERGPVLVSTVFLGIDYGLPLGGAPLLYETMVFGGVMDGQQWRWATREQAERGHTAVVHQVEEEEGGQELRVKN